MLNQLQSWGRTGLPDPQHEKREKRKGNLHLKKYTHTHTHHTSHILPLQVELPAHSLYHPKGEEWHLIKYSLKMLLHIKIFAKLFRIGSIREKLKQTYLKMAVGREKKI